LQLLRSSGSHSFIGTAIFARTETTVNQAVLLPFVINDSPAGTVLNISRLPGNLASSNVPRGSSDPAADATEKTLIQLGKVPQLSWPQALLRETAAVYLL
jgi:hypothetical protein